MTQELVDRIYECAFAPELWAGVLDELARMADARGGVLFTANGKVGILRWTASSRLHADLATYVEEGWLLSDRRRERVVAAAHAGFLTESDIFSAEELNSDPTIRDFYRPHGLGRTAITGVLLPTNDWLVMSIERGFADGPVQVEVIRLLDQLRPHLARSALMSARLQLERARAASEALALLGLPALVLDNRGRVVVANQLMETMGSYVSWRAQDHVSLKDVYSEVQFRRAVETLGQDDVPAVRSFALRGGTATAAMVAHVIPIRRTARDIFVGCAGVLVLTPVTLPQAPPIELLQSLFDLSVAEARVARHLAGGATVDEIASRSGVATSTIRTQVRGVLEKTGCRRQTEVVALMGSVGLPRT